MTDPWQWEITTAFEPGAGSVVEASGPHASWSDVDGIVAQWADSERDRTYLERVWLNRATGNARRAFTDAQVDAVARPGVALDDGDLVVLGFDGSKADDSTALVATRVSDGVTVLLALWERPHGPDGDGWEVPRDEPDVVLGEAFDRFEVWRAYADPRFRESDLARWAGARPGRVVAWPTNAYPRMAPATRVWWRAVVGGEWGFDGNPDLARHVRNVCRRDTRVRDEDTGEVLWVPGKETQRSPLKVDAAVACMLAWQARLDARAAGADRRPVRKVYLAAGF